MMQANEISIEVGGIVFRVIGIFSCGMRKDIIKIYQNLLSTKTPEVFIYIHWNKLPQVKFKEQNKIFNCKAGWSFYRDNNNTVLVVNSTNPEQSPHLVSVFSSDYKKNNIYISFDSFYRYFIDNSFPFLELMLVSLLSMKKGIIIHSSSVIDNNSGYLFVGKSGSGKSTMAKLWQFRKAVLLNDERTIIKKNNKYFQIFTAPRNRLSDLTTSQGFRLKKIFFIEHAKENEVSMVKDSMALPELLARSSIPFWNKEKLAYIFNFLRQLVSEVPCYKLEFLPNQSIVDYVRKWDKKRQFIS